MTDTVRRELDLGKATGEVTLTPSDDQSPESIENDLHNSEELLNKLFRRGVQNWRAHYQRVGPVKVMWYREVGPPPWRYPKMFSHVKPTKRYFTVGVGWRYTAYGIHVLWQPKQ